MTRDTAGKPPIFDSVEALTDKIDQYFIDCPDKRKIAAGDKIVEIPCFTITGLALHLGFASRQSLYDYEKNDKYSYIIKKARTFIEREYEKRLYETACTGAIFALKNMGWKDKHETELSGQVNGDLNHTINLDANDKDILNRFYKTQSKKLGDKNDK